MTAVFQEYRRSLLTFLIFISYAAVVFWGNYQFLQKLQENASIQQRLESEKRASVIAYYFSSRQDDVRDLAESEVIGGFFNNRDMGMSFQYGLGVNVELIEARFERMVAMKRVGDYPAYSGFVLLDDDGVSVASWNRSGSGRSVRIGADSNKNEVTISRGDKKGELLIKAPVWISQAHRGELLAWVNIQASLAQFGSLADGNFFLVDRMSGEMLSSGSDKPKLSDAYSRALKTVAGAGGGKGQIVLEDSEEGALAVNRIDIEGTPLSYVEISPTNAGATVFSRFFLVAAGVIPIVVLLLVFMDVRERRRLELLREQARIEAERLAQARSDFLANMSHEIRTPMNAIIGMTGLCLDSESDPKRRNYLSKIQRASDALLRIVNDVLDFSKIESGKLEIERIPFDMDRVLEGVGALFSDKAADKGIELIFDVDVSVTPMFIGDSLRLEQVLTNLIGNALKFADCGNVVVRMRSEMVDSGSARLRCEVIDEGIGVSPEQQARLFSPFTQADATTTRRFGGSGLGLVICKRLVEMMDGSIGVISRPDKGSTFWFDVRLGVDLRRASPIQEMMQQLRSFAQRPVLVVDANEACRVALEAQLGQLGLASESYPSVEAAISAVARDDAPDFLPVMVDFRLAQAEGGGLGRLREFSKTAHSLPVLLMTVSSHEPEAGGARSMLTAY